MWPLRSAPRNLIGRQIYEAVEAAAVVAPNSFSMALSSIEDDIMKREEMRKSPMELGEII